MKILKSFKSVCILTKQYKSVGKKVGLVVGGFDVLHLGHINLFRQAKRVVDILFVGLDSDQTLKLTKGENRPINNYYRRSQFLSEITLVDHVFELNNFYIHGDKKSDQYFINLYQKISPTHIFTHIDSDKLHSKRKDLAKRLGIKFVPDRTKYITTTSEILSKIQSEI